MKLNKYGQKFVEDALAEIDEDQIYSNIEIYDPEAMEEYKKLRKDELTKIALEYQNDIEFCWRHGKTDI